LKLAIIADIHGNADALEAVLDKVDQNNVDQVIIAGDLVGYYFEPERVLKLLEPWPTLVVRGNHEEYLSRARTDKKFLESLTSRYGPGIKIALEQLSIDKLDFLTSLPHPISINIEGSQFLICHGSPWDLNQYIYPDANLSLFDQCANGREDYIVLGHTHYSLLQTVEKTKIINPGSVGQPRNNQPGAHWVLLDMDNKSCSFHIESYDINGLVELCKKKAPNHPYLWEVLSRK